jgi:general secretion pathway protein G
MVFSFSSKKAIRSRRAFSLAEIIVAVTITALLAAIVVPTVMSRLAIGNGNAIAAELTNLGLGLKAFNTNVGTFPLNLATMATDSGTPKNYCGLTIAPTSLAKWRGPYVSRYITGDYTVNNSTILNLMTYTAGPPPYLEITINNVTADVARAIEEAIDGPVVANSYTTGSLTYATPNALYRIPVSTC